MSDNIFSARLRKNALRYGHDGLLAKPALQRKKLRPPLVESSLLAPDRGSTFEETKKILEYVVNTYPNDLINQANNFFKLINIPAASGSGKRKGRTVSHATVERYYQTFMMMIEILRSQNIKPLNLTEVSYKHLAIIIQGWEAKGLSSSTITNRYTVLKRIYLMMGKDQPPELRSILANPSIATRRQTATHSLDWEAHGISPETVINMIEAEDPRVATTLKLCFYFGLRLKEAVSFTPLTNISNGVILINKGAKGGRARIVPIETDIQRKVLEEACLNANPRTGFLGRSKQLDENMNHVYSVVRAYGITKNESGVSIHGLRHSYLNGVYEAICGVKSPINGGPVVNKDLDRKARLEVSRRAGHSRPRIASAYIGTHKNLSKLHRELLKSTLNSIQSNEAIRGSFHALEERLKALGCTIEMWLTGANALGQPTAPGSAINFALAVTKAPNASAEVSVDMGYQVFQACAEMKKSLSAALARNCIVENIADITTDTEVLALDFA